MAGYRIEKFPKTRIATIDVCEIGQQKHHIAAMIEIDVSESREKIKKHKVAGNRISFTAWLVKAISLTIKDYELVAAYLKGNREVVIFNEIIISMVVEKDLNGQKVPVPLLIEKANERSIESITTQISNAKNSKLEDSDIVLQKESSRMEKLYYLLPGFMRRYVWRYLLKHPKLAFSKMGNVAITSVGMFGKVNGWFIPKSVHPICFGIGSVIKKPVVIDNRIEIREMLNMTILLDHDVVDGVMMARFISNLTGNIEKGIDL